MPVRGYRSDLSIVSDPVLALEALEQAASAGDLSVTRREAVKKRHNSWRHAAAEAGKAGGDTPMSPAWMSRCVAEIMDDTAVAFSELGLIPGPMSLKGPNRLFSNVHAGGLGWSLPAALGAQLADRDRLVIASMGDGSYMFANPVACHQVAEALELPVLIIVKNNGMWNAVRRSVVNGYPDGAASRLNEIPLTSLAPLPDFCAIARASRAHAERVESGADLSVALERAVEIIRTERRHVLLDVNVAATDTA
jgi:acetolactate synthase-1/2/3 large subunit